MASIYKKYYYIDFCMHEKCIFISIWFVSIKNIFYPLFQKVRVSQLYYEILH